MAQRPNCSSTSMHLHDLAFCWTHVASAQHEAPQTPLSGAQAQRKEAHCTVSIKLLFTVCTTVISKVRLLQSWSVGKMIW